MDDGVTAAQLPKIMGVLNVTPDSFSDGGMYATLCAAVSRGCEMVDFGAYCIDVGGESTRPGSSPVPPEEERDRVVPVIEALVAARPAVTVSVDTSKTHVAAAAIDAGASIVNDVKAGHDLGMLELCAEAGVTVCLMHMKGTPLTMQDNTEYEDIVEDVYRFLSLRVEAAVNCGIDIEHIFVDPGIGFGKSLLDNLILIAAVDRFRNTGAKVLIGASRKRFIGHITGELEAEKRIYGSVGAALAAAHNGADMLRVHDVKATMDALRVFQGAISR